MSTAVALQRTISDLIAEYDEKVSGADAAISAFKAAILSMERATCVAGTYAQPTVKAYPPNVHSVRQNLTQSAWKAAYSHLQIDRLASATDKRKFERQIETPPEFTFENLRATFGDYFLRPRFHILRGLAETFTDLDPAYKSHAKVKIGVKGLPKRVILSHVGSYGSWGRDRLRDILNALAAYQGKPLVEHHEIEALLKDGYAIKVDREIPDPRQAAYERSRDGEKFVKLIGRGVWLKRFSNGNGHLYFGPEALLDINHALAEFYGEVLPDAEDDEPSKPRASTAVAKDLQYYPTPPAVVHAVLSSFHVRPGARVLEPSCGCGRFLDGLRDLGADTLGIEVHPGRAAEARAKGHAVRCSNFLDEPPSPEFDAVVMNPPFFGKLYMKHIRHAFGFIKPNGKLISILPATAKYDHGLLDAEFPRGMWRDLPVASFAESGTNVPTGYFSVTRDA